MEKELIELQQENEKLAQEIEANEIELELEKFFFFF